MPPMPADPYRSVPADGWRSDATRAPRPVLGRVLGAMIATVATGAMVVGAPAVAVGAMGGGLVLLGLTALVRRSSGFGQLRALPFPVVHAEAGGPVDLCVNPEAVRELTVTFVDELDDRRGEVAITDLLTRAPELVIDVQARAFVITGWAWLGQDLAMLVALLDTWGRQLHEVHPIAGVHVTWLRVPSGAG